MVEYVAYYLDPKTGAESPIEVFEADDTYTAEDYVSDCKVYADDEWNYMLSIGTVRLERVEE